MVLCGAPTFLHDTFWGHFLHENVNLMYFVCDAMHESLVVSLFLYVKPCSSYF